MIPSRILAAVLAILASATLVPAPAPAQVQPGQTPPEQRMAWYEDHLELVEASRFANLEWQFLGPTNISGRMTDVDVVTPKGLHYTIYVAGASGGVWKTENEGQTWEPILDEAISASIGDVTLAPSNQDIVWVGTGEANIFRSSMAGGGVYKSTDAGESWRHMGLTGTHTIPRIVIHPENPDIVWVAASGHEWTDNEERGVYKTTDGGDSWQKVLYVDERTGAIDLVVDPSNPDRLYAATWQRRRKKWNDPRTEEGHTGSGVWRTEDGGATWTPVNDGLPAAEHRGRIGIDVARSNPDVIYAFVDNYEIARMPEEGELDSYGRPRAPVIKGATVYRSDDRGESWRQTSQENRYMEGLSGTYGWVFGQMRVDPNDEDRIYVMGLGLNVSDDQGRTFRRLTGMHGDHHGLWIDPANSDYLVNVNDGGVDISYDAGENWRNLNDHGLTLVQFFNVGLDMDDPFRAYGSIQDHGSYRGVVDLSRGRHRIPAVQWESAPGGEGSNHAIDPDDPDVVYSAGFYGRMERTNMETGEDETIVPEVPEGEPQYRGQWLAPFIISRHNSHVLYLGLNHLFRSFDQGQSWDLIAEGLTDEDPAELGDIPFQTVFSIVESSLREGLLYVGTDDGHVWRSTDGGVAWTEITGSMPADRFIAEIVASRYDEGTVYVVQNGKRDDDFTPYVWKSTDHGDTWTSIADGVPSGPVNVIEDDPVNPDVLYLGTDLGAYVSLDDGESWEALVAGMPTTFVSDMVAHPRERILVASTHGRGMFAMDVSFVEQLTPEVLASGLHVLDGEDVALPGGGGGGFGGGSGFGGGGPSAYIAYWMSDAGSAQVEIRDLEGGTVRRLAGSGAVGFNRVLWDLENGDGERVDPGIYRVVVTAGGQTAEGSVTLVR